MPVLSPSQHPAALHAASIYASNTKLLKTMYVVTLRAAAPQCALPKRNGFRARQARRPHCLVGSSCDLQEAKIAEKGDWQANVRWGGGGLTLAWLHPCRRSLFCCPGMLPQQLLRCRHGHGACSSIDRVNIYISSTAGLQPLLQEAAGAPQAPLLGARAV